MAQVQAVQASDTQNSAATAKLNKYTGTGKDWSTVAAKTKTIELTKPVGAVPKQPK